MKKIRKILPVSAFDISGMEQWLKEQANDGLFPVFIDAWAAFTPTGKAGTRFCFEPCGKTGSEPSAEQLELYRGTGWEYALTVSNAYYLFYTEDPDAPELYSDRHSRGLSLERLEKKYLTYKRISAVIYALTAALLVWALFFYTSGFDVQPDRFARLPLLLVQLFEPIFVAFLLLAFFSWRRLRRDMDILGRTCRALKEEQPPPSFGKSRRMVIEHLLTLALPPVLLVMLIVNFISDNGGFRIPVERFDRPYVALHEIERAEIAGYEELFGHSPRREEENTARNRFSLLSPVWYEVVERGYSVKEGEYQGFSPNPEANGEFDLRYSPDLETVCMELLLPSLARPVAEAQMDELRLVNLRWSYEELQLEGLDFAIIADEPEGAWQMAALGRGNRIAVFRYGGHEELREHISLLSQLVMQA